MIALRHLLACGAVIAAAGLSRAADPPAPPASQPASAASKPSAAEVKAIVDQLITTDDPSGAVALFTKGRALDMNNLDLCRAYMRKMLTLGYPRMAYYAAFDVARLDAKDGTAWSTIAYYQAKESKFATAIDPAVRAAALLKDDASALGNLGQLMGWADEIKQNVSLSAAAAKMFRENEKTWKISSAYSGHYDAARAKMKTYMDAVKKNTTALQEGEKAEREAIATIRNGTALVRGGAARVADLTEDNKRNQNTLDGLKRLGGSGNAIRDYESRVNNTKNAINTLNGQIGQMTNKVNEATRTLTKVRDDATRVKADATKHSMPELEWSPPSVDGNATTDAEAKGKRLVLTAPVAAAPATPAAEGDPPAGAAAPAPASRPGVSDAQAALNLAKMLLQNNRTEKGIQSLREIILRFPNTPAAKEAQELLTQHENR